MKTSTQLIFVFALLLIAASAAQAQKKACPIPPPSPFKHNGTIVTSFDSSRGMRTTLTHPRAISSGSDAVYMTASFAHQKANRPGRLAVEIAFVAATKSSKYRNSHNLVFLADGKEFPLISAAQYQTVKAEHGATLEATKVTLPYDSLLNLLRARKVTTRIGQTEFELSGNHLEALRELASLMAPSPSKWASN